MLIPPSWSWTHALPLSSKPEVSPTDSSFAPFSTGSETVLLAAIPSVVKSISLALSATRMSSSSFSRCLAAIPSRASLRASSSASMAVIRSAASASEALLASSSAC